MAVIAQCRVGADNFAYLVICPATGQALAIDPGRDPEVVLGEIRRRGLKLVLLANTHGHADHAAGNAAIQAATGVKLAAHPADLAEADIVLEEGARLAVGQVDVTVLHTPGHTPGSVVFAVDDALITGDTLFVTRCGRADLRGSEPAALYASLLRLAAFPLETRIYPGHDYGPQPVSTIAYERTHNPYLRCQDLAGFIRLRMG